MCGCAVLPTNFRSLRLRQLPPQSLHQLKREEMRSCRSKLLNFHSQISPSGFWVLSVPKMSLCNFGNFLTSGSRFFMYRITRYTIPLQSLGSGPGPDYSSKIYIWSALFWLSGHLCQMFSWKQICFIASEELLLSPGLVGFRKLWLKFLLYLKILAFGFPEKFVGTIWLRLPIIRPFTPSLFVFPGSQQASLLRLCVPLLVIIIFLGIIFTSVSMSTIAQDMTIASLVP